MTLAAAATIVAAAAAVCQLSTMYCKYIYSGSIPTSKNQYILLTVECEQEQLVCMRTCVCMRIYKCMRVRYFYVRFTINLSFIFRIYVYIIWQLLSVSVTFYWLDSIYVPLGFCYLSDLASIYIFYLIIKFSINLPIPLCTL